MINKKILTALATGLLVCGLATTALAAPGKFSVQADELDYDMKTGQAIATGHVVIIQDNGKATGDNATYNSKSKSGVMKGNVVADRGDEHITCDEFKIINDNDYSAIGNAMVSKGGKKLFAPQVDYSKSREFAETFGGKARLVDVDGSVLNTVKLTYDAKTGVAIATGGVTIDSAARKLTASADKAIYDTKKEGFVELIGNATATQDGNTIKGQKLRLTNTSNVAIADGDVFIKYVPEQPAEPDKKKEGGEVVATEPTILNKEDKADA